MNYFKNITKLTIILFSLIVLVSITIKADLNFPITADSFSLNVNEAKAGPVYDDAELYK